MVLTSVVFNVLIVPCSKFPVHIYFCHFAFDNPEVCMEETLWRKYYKLRVLHVLQILVFMFYLMCFIQCVEKGTPLQFIVIIKLQKHYSFGGVFWE
jgi:hypothetical protein